MFLVPKYLGKFSIGLGLGVSFGWYSEDDNFSVLKHFAGFDVTLPNDYLRISDPSVDLSTKRELFTQRLQEQGASSRLVLMIGDYNRKAFEFKAINGYSTLTRKEQLDLLEETFKKYYPELLDSQTDREFISKLDLKLYCKDHYNVPDNLRTMR